jgi:isopenicillin N synthase-like dioxygenase
MAKIAVVSFERFLHGDENGRLAVANEVYEAFSTVGWVYLKDTGISQERVDEVFALVRFYHPDIDLQTS